MDTVLKTADPLVKPGWLVATGGGNMQALPNVLPCFLCFFLGYLVDKEIVQALLPWTVLHLPTVRNFQLCVTKVTKTQENHTSEASLDYHSVFEASLD